MTDINEIVSVTTRHRAAQLAANIQANNRLNAILAGYKPKPLTRKERLLAEIEDMKCRFRDALAILRGAEYRMGDDD